MENKRYRKKAFKLAAAVVAERKTMLIEIIKI